MVNSERWQGNIRICYVLEYRESDMRVLFLFIWEVLFFGGAAFAESRMVVLDESSRLTQASRYESSTQTDPVVRVSSKARITRGGGWYGDDLESRVSFRTWNVADDNTSYFLGFRLVRTVH